MTPRVHRHDLAGVSPLREGTNIRGRLGVGKIGSVKRIVSFGVSFSLGQGHKPMVAVQLVAGDSEGVVDGVRTTTENLVQYVLQ